jgi:uncharacterized protein (DUF58 family)
MQDLKKRSVRSRWPWRWLRRLRPPRRLRFTREGRYFVAITIGIGLAAINTGNNLLYLLLGWLLSMIIASGVMSERMMQKLAIRRRPAPRIFANQPFLMEISVENQKTRVSSFSIEIEDLIDERPLDKQCFFWKIPPGRTQRTSYRHTFHRRGAYCFEGFRVSTKFPFALFRKSRDVREVEEVLVYPATYPVPLPPPRAHYFGETQQAHLGRRGEFFGLREYQDGDDRRDIHWRSSARAQATGGRLLVREYEEEAQRRTTIAIDNALPPVPDAGALALRESERAEEALEQAISLAASLSEAYLGSGWAVRLMARGAEVPFATGAAQFTRILRVLALLPTVTADVPFAGSIDPRVESVLVVPRGVQLSGRPPQAAHVMEVGP